MDIPEVKFSQPVIIGIAVGAALLAIFLYFENQKMRKEMLGIVDNKRRPCGCNEPKTYASNETVTTPAGVHPSVVTGRLNTQPLPNQTPEDPNNPPQVVL